MTEAILAALRQLEIDRNVRVLYAVESGSRAWGFESEDSDYDVRFIYANTRDWYLTIGHHRDVIEEMLPDDLDLSGWDLRKALGLLQKSNPPLLEWLNSPIVYREESVVERLRNIAAEGWSPKHCLHHYLSMAEGNFRTYLQGERVRAKKYLYVLRPLLACRWIEQRQTLPPVLFNDLLVLESDRELLAAIDRLLEQTKAGLEIDDLPRDPVLHAFITTELARLDGGVDVPHRKIATETLDAVFRDVLAG